MTDFNGFDDYADELDDLADQFGEMADSAKELEGENEVSFEDLFTDQFMLSNTEFTSIEGFFEASPWDVESEEDFEEIPQAGLDEYVEDHTDLDSWEDMLSEASEEWIANQIGLH